MILIIRRMIVAVAIAVSAICFHTLNLATPVDGKKTNKSCIYCHTKYGSEELTEAGKYYRDKGTLDGYTKRQTSFLLPDS
mgnify:CR=1 FL=1